MSATSVKIRDSRAIDCFILVETKKLVFQKLTIQKCFILASNNPITLNSSCDAQWKNNHFKVFVELRLNFLRSSRFKIFVFQKCFLFTRILPQFVSTQSDFDNNVNILVYSLWALICDERNNLLNLENLKCLHLQKV